MVIELWELFFMLSGFCMMLGYGKKVMNRDIRFQPYIKRRIAKIYPLFLLTTLAVIVLELLVFRKTGEYFVYPNFDLYHLVLNLLLLQNGALETAWSLNSPSWVISICMLMYILLYTVCYWSKKPVIVYYVFAVGSILGSVIILWGELKPILNPLFGRGLSCFSIGVIIYGVYEARERFNSKRLAYVFLIFLFGFYALVRTEHMEYIGNYSMLITLGIAPMVMFCSFSIPWLKKLLSLCPFVFLGHISIGIYLIHFPAQCLIRTIHLYIMPMNYGSCLTWLGYTGLTLLLATVYTYVIKGKYEPWLLGLFASSKQQK